MYPKKKRRRRKLKKYNFFVLALALILIFLIAIDTILIVTYDILPYKYLLVYLVFIIGVPLILIQFMVRKKVRRPTKVLCSAFSIVLIVFLSLFFYYLYNTFSFLDNFVSYTYVTRNYKVLVPTNSEYQELYDINDKRIGYITLSNMNYDNALKELNKKITVTGKEYIDYTVMIEAFSLYELDSILTTDTYYEILKEQDESFESNYRIIYEFSIQERANEEIIKDVNVTKDCFNIFITGMDTIGNITSISRSDVNIVITVNPKTNQILMTHIPRDYYVKFPNLEDKDKLTHSGLYGTETTIKTIEDLLDIDINYYFKVNFNSVIDIVDALGGVDVYSDYTFISAGGNYYFKKGYNRVDGKKALAFVRTRKVLEGGDRARGRNQEALIQAVVKKASSPSILLKYTSLLDALRDKFMTNMSTDKITDIIKMQIDKMPNWTFTSISLDGADSENYTSVFPNYKVYVMEPYQETIDAAKEKIAQVFAGQVFDSSYQENNGNVNTPYVVKPDPPKKEETEKPTDSKEDVENKEDKKDEEASNKKDDTTNSKDDEENNSTTNPNLDNNSSTDKQPDIKDENDDKKEEDKTLEDNGLVPTN